MTTNVTRWVVPGVAFILGILIAVALMGRDASPVQVVLAFIIVTGYAVALSVLQSRSDLASVLSGLPRDERWAWINLSALSFAAQMIAIALVVAFLVTAFSGADSMPYAWLGAVFGASYLGGLVWYRSRS